MTPGSAWLKLALLGSGTATSRAFDTWFAGARGYVRRRNFYNSPDWRPGGAPALPQEIRLAGNLPVTVAVNVYGPSPWTLTWTEEAGPHVTGAWLPSSHPVCLPADLASVGVDGKLAQLCNLYGGSALSFFTPRSCYFFADGTQCRFCSLAGTARENEGYAARITPAQVHDAVTAVAAQDRDVINQVMIVGGNERNLDRGFRHQVALARAAALALADAGLSGDISVHLIAMPPRDLALIGELTDIPNVHAGFNLEAWDPARFAAIAPGKAADYGQRAILAALNILRDAVGPYRAHSILIAGLEPPASTLCGARALAADGISPIINVYHSDRHSALGLTIRPSYRQLAEVAVGLQDLHDSYPIQPYWKGCGRNALDYEASRGMFRGDPPDLA